jgi:hypothetical protein
MLLARLNISYWLSPEKWLELLCEFIRQEMSKVDLENGKSSLNLPTLNWRLAGGLNSTS